MLAAALAMVLIHAVLMPQEVTALTWGTPKALTLWGANLGWPGGAAAGSNGLAHIVYSEDVQGRLNLQYRRSTNGGQTWSLPYSLSAGNTEVAIHGSISASGKKVIVTWAEGSSAALRIYLRRSLDGGQTWQKRVALAPIGLPEYPRIAMDGAGHVLVAWTQRDTGRTYLRASGDGGLTFGSAVSLATTSNSPTGDGLLAFPTVAIGTGVAYVAYYPSPGKLVTRTSSTFGQTWSVPAVLATNGSGFWPDIAASGTKAIVTYAIAGTALTPAFRRTIDKGASWTAPAALTDGTVPTLEPTITFAGGMWRMLYERCTGSACNASETWYRESASGSSWSSPEKIGFVTGGYVVPFGITWAGSTIAAYTKVTTTYESFVRRGS